MSQPPLSFHFPSLSFKGCSRFQAVKLFHAKTLLHHLVSQDLKCQCSLWLFFQSVQTSPLGLIAGERVKRCRSVCLMTLVLTDTHDSEVPGRTPLDCQNQLSPHPRPRPQEAQQWTYHCFTARRYRLVPRPRPRRSDRQPALVHWSQAWAEANLRTVLLSNPFGPEGKRRKRKKGGETFT